MGVIIWPRPKFQESVCTVRTNFWMPALTYELCFGMSVHLHNVWVKVEYQGHEVKAKVIQA